MDVGNRTDGYYRNKSFGLQVQENIMLKQILNPTYNQNQWDKISLLSPSEFIISQTAILDYLLNNQRLFNLRFSIFYQNHQKIYHWYLLSHQSHYQIKQYVFFKLLNSPLSFYSQNAQFSNKHRHKKQQSQQLKNSHVKMIHTEPPQNFIFDYCKSQLSLQQIRRNERLIRQRLRIDFHDLYIKTFNACDGQSYIVYNFQKHMKGLREKVKYNDYIRKNHKTEKSFDQYDFIGQFEEKEFKIDKGIYQYVQFGYSRQKSNQKMKVVKVLKKMPNRFGRINFRLRKC